MLSIFVDDLAGIGSDYSRSFHLRRSLSVALDDGKCRVTPAIESKDPITPSFIASYPGSGAKMTWNLVEALTGILTGDEHRVNGHPWDKSVTVKAHYPHSHGSRDVGRTTNDQFPRAVLLMRHPKDAIPGYHNFLYEYANNLKGHSVRAPLEEWMRWRDENFELELKRWRLHTSYWIRRYSGASQAGDKGGERKGDLLILTYEGLTAEATGAESAQALARFLDRNDGVTSIPQDNVPCVWQRVIKYKGKAPPPPAAGSSSPSSSIATVEAAEEAGAAEAPKFPGKLESTNKEGGSGEVEDEVSEQDKADLIAMIMGESSSAGGESSGEPNDDNDDDRRGRRLSELEFDIDADIDEYEPSPYPRRRLADPNAPDSQRSGSKFRPYTDAQIDAMIDTLKELEETLQFAQLTPVTQAYIATLETERSRAKEKLKKHEVLKREQEEREAEAKARGEEVKAEAFGDLAV